MDKSLVHMSFAILVALFVTRADSQATFTFVNKCGFTVWPGLLSNAGVSPLPTTGFALQTGESQTITAPRAWGGRFWGRTHCRDGANGQFSCATGDCGSGQISCIGGAIPPVTLAEFTLDGADGKDFYDISLVDGFNLPMMVVPQGGSGTNCSVTECLADLNSGCPSELQVTSEGSAVACKSACEAFRSDEYCCSGAYGTPASCQPSQYARIFKSACPQAYSYAYDDQTSTFTCTGADYTVTFCPSPNTSQKSSDGQAGGVSRGINGNSPVDDGMVYQGGGQFESSASTCSSTFIAGGVALAMTMWRFLNHI